MKNIFITLVICLLFAGCYEGRVQRMPWQPPRYVDDCGYIAKKYNANTITIRDGNRYYGYARLTNKSFVWVSSGSDVTKTVYGTDIIDLRLAIANEMVLGVRKNPNPKPVDPDNPWKD